MQLQVECNGLTKKQQPCWACDRVFKSREARIIVCTDQGASCGEVCPDCLDRGFQWLQYRFDQLNRPQKTTRNRLQRKLNTLVEA
jgi:hypothetical protein